ncbi:hypothetical protein ACFLTN_07040 [Chloroflexota bacterium]
MPSDAWPDDELEQQPDGHTGYSYAATSEALQAATSSTSDKASYIS